MPTADLAEVVGIYAMTGAGALRGHVPEAQLDGFEQLAAASARAVGAHETTVSKARADRNLSPEGRASIEADAAKALRRALGELRRQSVEPLDKWCTGRRAALLEFGRFEAKPKTQAEAALAEQRAAEIRRKLEAVDPAFYLAEYEKGSDEVRSAMEGAAFPMLPAEFVAQQIEKRSRALDPGSWEQLEQQQLAAQVMGGALNAIERALPQDPDAPMLQPPAAVA